MASGWEVPVRIIVDAAPIIDEPEIKFETCKWAIPTNKKIFWSKFVQSKAVDSTAGHICSHKCSEHYS